MINKVIKTESLVVRWFVNSGTNWGCVKNSLFELILSRFWRQWRVQMNSKGTKCLKVPKSMWICLQWHLKNPSEKELFPIQIWKISKSFRTFHTYLISQTKNPKIDAEIDPEAGPKGSSCVAVCPVIFKPYGCGTDQMFRFELLGDELEFSSSINELLEELNTNLFKFPRNSTHWYLLMLPL